MVCCPPVNNTVNYIAELIYVFTKIYIHFSVSFFIEFFCCSTVWDSGISIEQKSEAPKYGILDELNIGQTPLKSERKGAIATDATKITIKTNVPNSEIFINGNFEGYSTLTITNLPEGKYNLKVEKKVTAQNATELELLKAKNAFFTLNLNNTKEQSALLQNLRMQTSMLTIHTSATAL